MFNFIFKGGTYFILYKKFRQEFFTVLLSIIALIVLLSLYDDLFKVLKITDQQSIIYLLIFKWFIIVSIVVFNYIRFKRIHIADAKKKTKAPHVQELMNQKKLKTKSDIIIQKYLDDIKSINR